MEWTGTQTHTHPLPPYVRTYVLCATQCATHMWSQSFECPQCKPAPETIYRGVMESNTKFHANLLHWEVRDGIRSISSPSNPSNSGRKGVRAAPGTLEPDPLHFTLPVGSLASWCSHAGSTQSSTAPWWSCSPPISQTHISRVRGVQRSWFSLQYLTNTGWFSYWCLWCFFFFFTL